MKIKTGKMENKDNGKNLSILSTQHNKGWVTSSTDMSSL
jgi:hypothetical protein